MELTLLQKWFPETALKREIARSRIQAVKEKNSRYYDGGQSSTYRRPVGPDISPQGLMQQAGEGIRQYVRNLDENSDVVIGILDTLVNNVVGAGMPIRPLIKNRDGSLNVQANEQMARILAEWSKAPTADRQQSFANAQRLLCRTWLRDGEVIVNKLMGHGSVNHRGTVPYSIELMECDYLPYMLNESTPRLIVQGVEITRYYEPISYYLAKTHPGDMWNNAAAVWTSESDYRRVDAKSIIHLKFTRRINQVRGVSLLHGAIRTLEDIKDYTESERIAARIAAAFSGYIKKSPDVATEINPDTGNRDLEMAPGMIFDNLLPGEEIGTINSNRPNTAINEFTDGLLKKVAAGTMSSYSTIARDYDGSYSSQRQAMVEAKPNYDILRDYFGNQCIKPIYHDLLDLALASGALKVPRSVDPETLHDVGIADVAMPWIDPKKEIEADILRIDSGLASRSQVIAERGGDPAAVAKMIENDKLLFPDLEVKNEQAEEPNTVTTEEQEPGGDSDT